MLFVACCMVITDSYAQKVVVEGEKVIIDTSGLRNTTGVKKAIATNGTNTTLGTEDVNNIGSQVSNEKVYHKFEVSKVNNASVIDWLKAVEQCKNLNQDGIGWRLPTQRELQLIYILKQELEQQSGFAKFSDSFFWSATEAGATHCWYVNLGNGDTSYYDSKISHETKSVRCIRDL